MTSSGNILGSSGSVDEGSFLVDGSGEMIGSSSSSDKEELLACSK